MRREPEVEEDVPVVECFDCLARITSKGTCTNSFCEKWHPPECLFYKTKSGCRFGEKCSNAHRQVDEQPSKRSTKNVDKSAVAMLKKGDWQEREPCRGFSYTVSFCQVFMCTRVCLPQGPLSLCLRRFFDVIRCTSCSETVLRPSS